MLKVEKINFLQNRTNVNSINFVTSFCLGTRRRNKVLSFHQIEQTKRSAKIK